MLPLWTDHGIGYIFHSSKGIKFQVSDNGRGIPLDDLERIFEPFYRVAHESKEAQVSGTGLGLALAKTLVELHGGKIWAESPPGEGSVFCFTIPLEGSGDTRARRGN